MKSYQCFTNIENVIHAYISSCLNTAVFNKCHIQTGLHIDINLLITRYYKFMVVNGSAIDICIKAVDVTVTSPSGLQTILQTVLRPEFGIFTVRILFFSSQAKQNFICPQRGNLFCSSKTVRTHRYHNTLTKSQKCQKEK